MNSQDRCLGRAPGDAPVGTRPSNVGAGRLAHQIDHQRIAARAYEIYESRQREEGHADEHWRQAEAEYAVRRANDLTAARG